MPTLNFFPLTSLPPASQEPDHTYPSSRLLALVIDEHQKAEVIFQHFDDIIGNYGNRLHGLDFSLLNLHLTTPL
jgi:hypothetical protein